MLKSLHLACRKALDSCPAYFSPEGESWIPATAACTAWGRIIEHEAGWRCQHMRIDEIYLLGSAADDWHVSVLTENYGVPVYGVPVRFLGNHA
jgi:hypothetical protein